MMSKVVNILVSVHTETNNDGQTVRYGNVEDGRLNRQTMMGKDYQLV